jgi:hypothetical protein
MAVLETSQYGEGIQIPGSLSLDLGPVVFIDSDLVAGDFGWELSKL